MQRLNGTWQEEAKMLHLVPGIASFLTARRPPPKETSQTFLEVVLLTATGAKNFTPHLNSPFITR